jgi:hypothetical protein
VRSPSIAGSATAEASPRVEAFFLERILDEPALDAVRLPHVEQFLDAEPFVDGAPLLGVVQLLDAARPPYGVRSPGETQQVDEEREQALLELRPVFLGEVQVWPVG